MQRDGGTTARTGRQVTIAQHRQRAYAGAAGQRRDNFHNLAKAPNAAKARPTTTGRFSTRVRGDAAAASAGIAAAPLDELGELALDRGRRLLRLAKERRRLAAGLYDPPAPDPSSAASRSAMSSQSCSLEPRRGQRSRRGGALPRNPRRADSRFRQSRPPRRLRTDAAP